MDRKYKLFCEIMQEMDTAYDLMVEYDSLPHKYGQNILYQAESHMIGYIGEHEGVTITELSNVFKKTRSACSQLVKKLCEKNWVKQVRNEQNKREYKLFLTEKGEQIVLDHEIFETACYQRCLNGLTQFSYEELENYLAIQKKINDSFKLDVEESYQYRSLVSSR